MWTQPIITFDCPNGPGEIVEDGFNGFVIGDVGNVDKLSNAICSLIENEELRCSMGEASLISVQKFSEDIIRPQWVKLFNEILKN